MLKIGDKYMEWYEDLCEYYGVSPEQAIELGTRKTGRKPNLPSSKTCHEVNGKTFEELWDMKPRNTIQEKMDFYQDIGAWQVFRQCNYRHNFNYGSILGDYFKNNASILEYGCGIAPFTNFIIEQPYKFKNINIDTMKFTLVDVIGEHLHFAKWRLSKKAPHVNFDFHEITPTHIIPNFKCNFDIICIMDVLEHLPNPYDIMTILNEHSNKGAILVETWVDKSNGGAYGPDLEEAERERKITIDLINSSYDLIKNGSIRIHKKK